MACLLFGVGTAVGQSEVEVDVCAAGGLAGRWGWRTKGAVTTVPSASSNCAQRR
jgi:hypothetical protein